MFHFYTGVLHLGPAPDQTQPFPAPSRTPRLLLQELRTGTGEVDGAWWPWTADLPAELDDLIAAVTPRMGPIARVGFDWNASSSALDQPPAVMRLTGTDGSLLILRVIPFDTPVQLADEQLRQAARLRTSRRR
ncbi:DUF5994 family protein [Nocardia heshunensis]